MEQERRSPPADEVGAEVCDRIEDPEFRLSLDQQQRLRPQKWPPIFSSKK